MKPRPGRLFLALCCSWFSLSLCAAVTAPIRPAAELLRDADALAAEGSWDLAAQAYQQALTAAAADADPGLARLGLIQARFLSLPRYDPRRYQGAPQLEAELAALIPGIAPSAPVSDFELRVHTITVELLRDIAPDRAQAALDRAIRRLATQPAAPAHTTRLVAFLHGLLGEPGAPGPRISTPALVATLKSLRERALDAPSRAWAAFALTQLNNQSLPLTPASIATWQQAVAAARDTVWAPQVDAAWLLWQTDQGWSGDRPLGTPRDVLHVIAEAERCLDALRAAPDTGAAEVFQTHLATRLKAWREPRLQLSAHHHFLSDEAVQFAWGAAGNAAVTFRLFRLPTAAAFPSTWPDSPEAPELRGHEVNTWTVAVPDTADLHWHSEVNALSSPPGPGCYLLFLTGEATPSAAVKRVAFTVSDIQATLVLPQLVGPPAELLLTDLRTGAPLADAPVAGFSQPRDGPPTIWRARTDAGGRTTGVVFPALTSSDARRLDLAGEVGGQPFRLSCHLWQRAPETAVELIVDRPLYRPGETVHWQVLARERQDHAWQFPTGTWSLHFGLDEVDLQDLTGVAFDPFGSLAGEFTLPGGLKPGDIELTLTQDATGQEQSHDVARVDNFVPPALTATLTYAGPSAGLRPGADLEAHVEVSYLSGGGAAGTPVALMIQPVFRPTGVSPYARDAIRRPDPIRLDAVTNAAGRATFHWSNVLHEAEAQMLFLTAEVLPRGGQPVKRQASWRLLPTGVQAEFDGATGPRLVTPHQAVTQSGTLTNGADQPVALAGTAEWVSMTWQGVYLRTDGSIATAEDIPATVGPGSLPADWTTLREGYVETVVSGGDFRTGSDGRFAIDFTPTVAGLYRLRLLDEFGRELTPHDDAVHALSDDGPADRMSALHLVVADANTTRLPVPRRSAWLLAPRRVTQDEPLRALLIAPLPIDEPLLCTVVQGGATHTRILPAGARLQWIDLSAATAQPGPGQLILGAGRQRAALRTFFQVVPKRATPRIELTLDPTTRPGAQLQVELQTTTGEERAAWQDPKILLVAADTAVLQLADDFAEAPTVPFARFEAPEAAGSPQIIRSTAPDRLELEPPADPRPGLVVHATGGLPMSDDEFIVLSPFSVDAEATGYYSAAASVAGTRIGAATMSGSLLDAKQAALTELNAPRRPEPSEPDDASGASPIRIRRHFASTAAWMPDLRTDARGNLTTTITVPDNLTDWRVLAYAIGAAPDQFALASATVKSSLPFQARLQTPRHLIVGDHASPSLLLVNRTAAAMNARPELSLTGPATLGSTPAAQETRHVPAGGEARADWDLVATGPGELTLTGTARTADETDGMQVSLPVREDGSEQTVAASARVAPTQRRTTLVLTLPAPLDHDRLRAELRLGTSPAAAVLDALPYLIDYPYGCVEQTMSRFLPAIAVRHTLTQLGLDPAAVETRILGTEIPADARRRRATAGLAHLDDVVTQSLDRLVTAQTDSGGFGWWPNAAQDDPWMTAYVAWGLGLAERADIQVPIALLEDALERCAQIAQDAGEGRDHRVWALTALSAQVTDRNTAELESALTNLFADRAELTATGRAALALAVARFGTATQRAIIVRNLSNATIRETDAAGDLVHWGADRDCWNALDGAHEATALSVLALLELAPADPLIEPAVAWLALNRSSAHWTSTRDTTFAALALSHFLARQDAANAPIRYQIRLNGSLLPEQLLSPADLLAQPLTVALPTALLRPGPNQIELRRLDGTGPVQATALATAWAAGNSVQPAAHRAALTRTFVREHTTPTVVGQLRVDAEPQPTVGRVRAGEQVNAVLRLQVAHELHYVMVKVPKPAGCEPLNPLSGWDATLRRVEPTPAADRAPGELSDTQPAPPGRPLYREEHDDHSAFFIDRLEPGDWELTFPLRAVTPGDFRALPAEIEAMYVPAIRANTDARRLNIALDEP